MSLGPRERSRGHLSTTYPAPGSQPEGMTEAVLLGVASLLGAALRGLWQAACRFPRTACMVVLLGVIAWTEAFVPLSVLGAEALAAVLVLRLLTGLWWRRHVLSGRPNRQRARWLARSWPVLCDRVGLMVTDRDRRSGAVTESMPRLSGLHWSPDGTVLTGQVALVPGQVVEDLGEVAERLGEAAGAHRCRITRTGPAQAELALLYGDPLHDVVAPLPLDGPVDLTALPVGVREDGRSWLLRLLGTHVLVVGVTGAGKGSVVWSLLRALAPAIQDGSVAVWAVDGKAGMELAPGRSLFTRLATTIEDGVELLEDAVTVMSARAARLAGYARTHVPTVEDPLLVVLVDEVALLTAYQPDRKLRERAEKALATIATQGRAPGVVLVAALQDPRKEVLGLRNLFPTKIAMRLDEKTQVDMVLGDGARDAGALCHQIPDTQPGVAYVKLDGQREPVRVRASYLTDEQITQLADTYPATQWVSHD